MPHTQNSGQGWLPLAGYRPPVPPSAESLRERTLLGLRKRASSAWFERAKNCVLAAAREKFLFTMDDVLDRAEALGVPIDPPGQDRRAWGAVVRAVRDSGAIQHTGNYRSSKRPQTHASPKAIWRYNP